jgi:hypothetical protein
MLRVTGVLVCFLCAALVGLSSAAAERAPAAPASAADTCTPAQKAKRERALADYKRRMAAERKAYFRTHRSPAQRKAFVTRQRAKLGALQRAAACTVPPPLPSPPPPPPPPPPPAPPVFTFGLGITEAQADEVRRGIEGVRVFLATIDAVPPRLDVRVWADLESTVQAYAVLVGVPVEVARHHWATSTAITFREFVLVNAGSPGWTQATTRDRAKTLAHEVFHVVQGAQIAPKELIGVPDDQIPIGGPRWLIEGAAEVGGFSAIAHAGLYPLDQARAEQVARSKLNESPLPSYATQPEWQRNPRAVYSLAFVAVDYLTRGRGLQSLVAFWRVIGRGASWQDAFATAFGRSIDTFYAEFETYRRGYGIATSASDR